MTRRFSCEAGLTLVEALVSLFVFSLLAMGGAALLYQSVESQRAAREAHGALRELQTARALLASDAAQMALRPSRTADGAARPALVGGDARVALGFVRAAGEPDPQAGGRTSLAYVEYAIDADGRLVRRSTADIDAAAPGEATERVLLADAKGAHFEFFDGAEWRSQWLSGPGGEAPPRAIALVAEAPRYGAIRLEALVALQ